MSIFWIRGRDRRAETEDATAAGTQARSWRLTAVDRCDRCGAQAYVRVLLPSRLELLFCAHHNRKYSSALADIAVEIQDETVRLAYSALSGILCHSDSPVSDRATRVAGSPAGRGTAAPSH
jgi:hypothetical protein